MIKLKKIYLGLSKVVSGRNCGYGKIIFIMTPSL